MGNTRFRVPVDPKPFDRSTWNLTWVITSAVWPHTPKIVKIGPAGPPWHRGEISCSNVFFYFYIFLVTSCQALENTFLGVSPPFLCQTTWCGEDWFPTGGPNFNTKIFPHLNPQKRRCLDLFLDLENFRPKRFIMGRFTSKLPLIVTAAPWKLQSE